MSDLHVQPDAFRFAGGYPGQLSQLYATQQQCAV